MQGSPRDDREWEHWPGRRPPDESIRHRLRALFAATDDEESVDALITDRGRELEEQTERLQETIESLERREEQAARLRSAVEEMLRHGSAELDERHAELAAFAVALRGREEAVRERERDLALRTQELGAVELRRAAVERREAALEQMASDLGDRELQLVERERSGQMVSDPVSPTPEPAAATHLLYVARDGWQLVERAGPVPPLDAHVEIDGVPLVVTRVGRSPLPDDLRACAYMEAARSMR